MKTKAGSRQPGSMGKLSLFASLSHSLCLSASLSHSPRWLETMAKGIVARNTELEDYSLFPSTADVICVPLNCCILCGSNLQSYCVKHAPWLLRDCCWQALHIRLKKKNLHATCSGLTEFYPQSMKNYSIFLLRYTCACIFSFDCPLLSFAWWDYSFCPH